MQLFAAIHLHDIFVITLRDKAAGSGEKMAWRTIASLPLFTRLQTYRCAALSDVMGQKPTHALQQTARHSMSWSARSRKDSEIVSPIALAILRFITSANLVGCWTGRSEGLAPFKILST